MEISELVSTTVSDMAGGGGGGDGLLAVERPGGDHGTNKAELGRQKKNPSAPKAGGSDGAHRGEGAAQSWGERQRKKEEEENSSSPWPRQEQCKDGFWTEPVGDSRGATSFNID